MLRILHGADLHLDSPFSHMTPEAAAEHRLLQRQLPRRMVELANKLGCQMLLLSGDVFDGPRPAPETVRELRQALEAFRGQVFVAPGNHDPYDDGSVWQREHWPDRVHIFSGTTEVITLPELHCRVWGGGFTAAACHEPLPQVEQDGWLHLGVFHGSLEDPGPYRPIRAKDVAACGLDYLALGHIHAPHLPEKIGATWVGWPGVTMGRGFDECGIHGVLLVELEDGDCHGQFLPLSNPRYEVFSTICGGDMELPEDCGMIHGRIILRGEAEEGALAALERRLRPRFLTLELRDETRPAWDVWQGCGDGTLRGLALELLRQQPEGELAARYLLASLEGGEEP